MTPKLQNIFEMFKSSDPEIKLLGFTLFCDSEEVKNLTSKSFYRYIQHYRQYFNDANEARENGFPKNIINKCINYVYLQLLNRREFRNHEYVYPVPSIDTLYYKGFRLY